MTTVKNFKITRHDADDLEKLVNHLRTDPRFDKPRRAETVAVLLKASDYWSYEKTSRGLKMTVFVAFFFEPGPSGDLEYGSTIFSQHDTGLPPSNDDFQACFLDAKRAANVPCVRSLWCVSLCVITCWSFLFYDLIVTLFAVLHCSTNRCESVRTSHAVPFQI